MFNLKTYKPNLFSGDWQCEGSSVITAYSKDSNALIFMLSDKEKYIEFEKITGYNLSNKTSEDLINEFTINLVKIDMDTKFADISGFYYPCKMTLSLQNNQGKCFDIIVFEKNFDEDEQRGFCWNMRYGFYYHKDAIEPEFYYR